MFPKYDPKFMEGNDDVCHYFSGLSWNVFDIVCNYVTPYLKPPTRRNIALRNQVLRVLVRLRMNLPFRYLSHQMAV